MSFHRFFIMQNRPLRVRCVNERKGNFAGQSHWTYSLIQLKVTFRK